MHVNGSMSAHNVTKLLARKQVIVVFIALMALLLVRPFN